MVNLKNYNVAIKPFVLFLTFIFTVSCSHQKLYVTQIEGKQIPITNQIEEVAAIEAFIKPYRDHIDVDLSTFLAYAPQTIDKSGEWQSAIGNLFADICLQKGNLVFHLREKKAIDLCVLNHGGIRSIIPKGDVTPKTAFEIMPFENNLVVIALKGAQIYEIAEYIISEKKPHPLSGMTFTIDAENKPKNIQIQGKPFNIETIYYVATNDYLANGGDNMLFFKEGIQKYDLDYKLRNILIDYFKEVDTIPVITDVRITKE